MTGLQENSNAKQFRGKPLPFEDELTILFSPMTRKDCAMLCVDGIGDRAPRGGCDDSHTRISEDSVGWPEKNVGGSSVGRVRQRSSKDHVVDSRPTKKTTSMVYYLKRICESLRELIRDESSDSDMDESSDSDMEGEQEMAELLQLVREDGVSEESELFFIATCLFRSPARRAAFRCIGDPNARIAWLQRTWDSDVKK